MVAVMLERFDRTFDPRHDPLASAGMPGNESRGGDDEAAGDPSGQDAAGSEADAAHDAGAAAAERLASSVDTLVTTLVAMGQQLEDIRRRAMIDVAEALSPAIAELLPSVFDSGFADEVAGAVTRIVEEGRLAEATLTLSESDHDAVIERLSSLHPRLPIAVRGDPAMQPGTARLGWLDGGAHIDRDALLGAASDLLQSRLETLRGTRS